MKLRETKILDLLREKPGRFIQHDMGKYTMKEANGSDPTSAVLRKMVAEIRGIVGSATGRTVMWC